MLKDTKYRLAEVVSEFWLALECLSTHYHSIDPEDALRDEYAVARGQDLTDGVEPLGIVLIEPATPCFLFCLVSALAPALAAGNAVIVHVSSTYTHIVLPMRYIYRRCQDRTDLRKRLFV